MEMFIGFFGVFAGLFAIYGAVRDWDWFMNDVRARVFVALLGRTGARGFYILLGIGLIGLGLMMVFGLFQHPSVT